MTNPNDLAFPGPFWHDGPTKRELAAIHANIPWETAHERLAFNNQIANIRRLTDEEVAAYRAKLMVIQADALITELAKEK